MIYMDYSATSFVKDEVFAAMKPYFQQKFGNASSIHQAGREARAAVDAAREQCAAALGATPRELYFTSGGTEADNLAIFGAVFANSGKGRHILTTQIEHHAVLHPLEHLAAQGYEVTFLPVDEQGIVEVCAFEQALRPDTVLASVMYANNEIGTLQPIPQLARLCQANGTIFHTDAVQAFGHVPIDVSSLGIDMLSLSGHKVYGPKGVGLLYVRQGVKFQPMMWGGAHEFNRRPGTENVPGIVGLGVALELANKNRAAHCARLLELREKLIDGLFQRIPDIRLNGDRKNRLPGNANISFAYVEGESILLNLDLQGICASSGSACTSGSLDPSHVLLAIGLDHETAHGSIRFSLGEGNTQADVDRVLQIMPPLIQRLRNMSPLYPGNQ